MERRTGKIRRTFSRMHRALDGWMLAIARRLHQLKASTTTDLGISIFHFCTMCGLRNSELLIKTGWNVICPVCCREHWYSSRSVDGKSDENNTNQQVHTRNSGGIP